MDTNYLSAEQFIMVDWFAQSMPKLVLRLPRTTAHVEDVPSGPLV